MICDFIECKCNIDSKCIASSPIQCPKNNNSSVYENLELIKDNDNG